MEYEKVRKVGVCLGKRQNVHIIIIGSLSILLVKNSSPLFGLFFFLLFFFLIYLLSFFFFFVGEVQCAAQEDQPHLGLCGDASQRAI